MGVEAGVGYIDDLVVTNPESTDVVAEGDDHLRLTKAAVKGSFTSLGREAVTKTAAEINDLATITGTETLTNKTLTSPIINGGLQLQTSVASTSGSTIDVSGIPSWVKKISINLMSVKTSGTLPYLFRIGDSGGIESNGYVGGYGGVTSGGFALQSTATSAIGLHRITNIEDEITGHIFLTLSNESTNTWLISGTVSSTGGSTTETWNFSGTKSLTTVLDRFQISCSTDTFNAGSISAVYE